MHTAASPAIGGGVSKTGVTALGSRLAYIDLKFIKKGNFDRDTLEIGVALSSRFPKEQEDVISEGTPITVPIKSEELEAPESRFQKIFKRLCEWVPGWNYARICYHERLLKNRDGKFKALIDGMLDQKGNVDLKRVDKLCKEFVGDYNKCIDKKADVSRVLHDDLGRIDYFKSRLTDDRSLHAQFNSICALSLGEREIVDRIYESVINEREIPKDVLDQLAISRGDVGFKQLVKEIQDYQRKHGGDSDGLQEVNRQIIEGKIERFVEERYPIFGIARQIREAAIELVDLSALDNNQLLDLFKTLASKVEQQADAIALRTTIEDKLVDSRKHLMDASRQELCERSAQGCIQAMYGKLNQLANQLIGRELGVDFEAELSKILALAKELKVPLSVRPKFVNWLLKQALQQLDRLQWQAIIQQLSVEDMRRLLVSEKFTDHARMRKDYEKLQRIRWENDELADVVAAIKKPLSRGFSTAVDIDEFLKETIRSKSDGGSEMLDIFLGEVEELKSAYTALTNFTAEVLEQTEMMKFQMMNFHIPVMASLRKAFKQYNELTKIMERRDEVPGVFSGRSREALLIKRSQGQFKELVDSLDVYVLLNDGISNYTEIDHLSSTDLVRLQQDYALLLAVIEATSTPKTDFEQIVKERKVNDVVLRLKDLNAEIEKRQVQEVVNESRNVVPLAKEVVVENGTKEKGKERESGNDQRRSDVLKNTQALPSKAPMWDQRALTRSVYRNGPMAMKNNQVSPARSAAKVANGATSKNN